MGNLTFTEKAWDDYNYWLTQDRKTLRRINQLLADIQRNGYTGIGKPEPLKGNLSGLWSRRIDEINRLDVLLSTGKDTSQVACINQNGSAVLNDDTQTLLQKSLELYESTGHRFDITIYPIMRVWGFPTQEYRVPEQDEIAKTLELVGSDKLSYDEATKTLTLRDGMAIDFGGIAKGYTSSKLMDIFRKYGVSSAMVSLGGNVQVLGAKTDGSDWRVAVQNPDGTDDYLGILAIKDKAVITSGGYERYSGRTGCGRQIQMVLKSVEKALKTIKKALKNA